MLRNNENYEAFLSAYEAGYDVHAQIILEGLTYEESEIVADSIRINGDLYAEDAAGIGGTCAREIEFSVIPKDAHKYSVVEFVEGEPIIDPWYELSEGATVLYFPTTDTIAQKDKVYYEETGEANPKPMTALLNLYIIKNGSRITIPKGTYKVSFDSRDPMTGVYTYKGTDILAKLAKPYEDSANDVVWPKNALDVVMLIANRFGITVDPRTESYFQYHANSSLYAVGYPGNKDNKVYNYRDILMFIATMLGGNWTITDEGALLFVPLQQTPVDIVYDLNSNVESLDVKRRSLPIGGVEVDLMQADAVTGDELYREYIPFVPCSDKETTVKSNRLYYLRTETMFTPVDLNEYEDPTAIKPFNEGWFELAKPMAYDSITGYYTLRINPSERGWYEYNAIQGYHRSTDISVRASYFKWYNSQEYRQGEYQVKVTDSTLQQSITFVQGAGSAYLVMICWDLDASTPVYDSMFPEVQTPITVAHTYEHAGTYRVGVLVNDQVTGGTWWVTVRPEGAVLIPEKNYYLPGEGSYFQKYSGYEEYPQGRYKVSITAENLEQSLTFYQTAPGLVMINWDAGSSSSYDSGFEAVRSPIVASHQYSAAQVGDHFVEIAVDSTVMERYPNATWWVTVRPSAAVIIQSTYSLIDINAFIGTVAETYEAIDINTVANTSDYVPETDGLGYYVAQFRATPQSTPIDISPVENLWYEYADATKKYESTIDTIARCYYFKWYQDGGGFYTLDVPANALTQSITFAQETAGLISVDWGDGSPLQTDPHHVAPQTVTMQHTYEEAGTYVLSLRISNPYFRWNAESAYREGEYFVTVNGATLEQSITFYQTHEGLVRIRWGEITVPIEEDNIYSDPPIGPEFEKTYEAVTIKHTYRQPGSYYVQILVDHDVKDHNPDAAWWVTARPAGAQRIVNSEGQKFWVTNKPSTARLFTYKEYYTKSNNPVILDEFIPTHDMSIVSGKKYYTVGNYERLSIGADEVKRGINPSENQWYEYDAEGSIDGVPVFVPTTDHVITVYDSTYDYEKVEINEQYDDVNPSEKEWYEYDKAADSYSLTKDTTASIHYWYEWVYGKHVAYKIDLTKQTYYKQTLDIRQSVPNLVMVNWGDPNTPAEERIEMDAEHTWVTGGDNNSLASFSHNYGTPGVYILTIDINPDIVEQGIPLQWEVVSRPPDTVKYSSKNYYERVETTVQKYKYYYRRITPEYQLIDPDSPQYMEQNPYANGWYRHKYGDKIIKAMCPWATDEGLKDMFESVIKGFRYQAYEASAALIPPMVELGDTIKINGTVSVFAHFDTTLGLLYNADISAPGESENFESDGGNSVSMTERKASMAIANALSAANDKTANSMTTSRRVILYLDNNLSDDNFFHAHNETTEWISGTVVIDYDTGVPKETQYRDEDNNLLYWDYTDGDVTLDRDIRTAQGIAKERSAGYPMTEAGVRLKMTTVQTSFPVRVYQYKDLVKASLGFGYDPTTKIYMPMLTFGAGDEAGNNIARFFKTDKAFTMLYTVPSTAQIRAGETIGFVAGRDGFLDIIGLRRTDKMVFTDWDRGIFTEKVEGIDTPIQYAVYFDGQGRPIEIQDGNEHSIEIEW